MRIDELEEILGIDSLVLFLERFGGSMAYILVRDGRLRLPVVS